MIQDTRRNAAAVVLAMTVAVVPGCSSNEDEGSTEYSCTAEGTRDARRLTTILSAAAPDARVVRGNCDSGGPAGVTLELSDSGRDVVDLLTHRYDCTSYEIVGPVTQDEPRILLPCTIKGIRTTVDVDQSASPQMAWVVPERSGSER